MGRLESLVCDRSCPGLRPEAVREERRSGLRYGGSDDGGFAEVVESAPHRRSNSAIRVDGPRPAR